MAKVAKEMSVLRTTSRFFRHHPFILCSVFLLVILYKCFFRLFAFLVASSPVFLFAGFLLGIILTYGEPNVPDNEHVYKKIRKVRCRNIGGNGKTVRGVSLPRIQSNEDRVVQDNGNEKKTRNKTDHHDASSESEPSQSDSSETEILPMLNAFHQLTNDESAATSTGSSQDGDSDVSSIEDGTENQEDNDEDDRGEKEDVKVVLWTADDQKNLLNIGSLEIERNQRLENLIARRRARKLMERNLIDLDGNDSLPSIEELSKFNVQIPAVFAPRKNPFDLPYDEGDFPGSAPSVLLPMRNPFDLPCEQTNESGSIGEASSSNPEPVPVPPPPQRNVMFRRHESFTIGAPFFGDFCQDQRPSRFKPYFVPEKMVEGIEDTILEGEPSEKSDSKMSSVQDSDSVSSVTDQESQKELSEDNSNQEREPPFGQKEREPPSGQRERELPIAVDIEPPVLISDSSDDDISLPDGLIKAWEEANDGERGHLANNVLLEDTSAMECHQEDMEMTNKDFHQMSPRSNDGESVSSSTEASEKPSEVDNLELPGKEVEVVDDTQIVDPVYDSSPSANEKSVSIVSALDEALLHEGNSSGSDSQVNIHEHSGEIAWVAPSLASVEENEMREREISEIREHDIFGHGMAREGFGNPVVPVLSDISTQLTTSGSTDGKSGNFISSSKKAVFGFFRK